MSLFSRIWTEYREIWGISPYSVWMRKTAAQKNSEYRHFSRSANEIVQKSHILHITDTQSSNGVFFSEAYSEPCQSSKMESFAKIVGGQKLSTTFAKRSIFDR